jgi:hypothetical protein
MKDMMAAATAGSLGMQDLISTLTLYMTLVDTDLYYTVFELVCDALVLDFQSCRHNAALHLVINPSNHPSIGILNRSYRDLGPSIDNFSHVTVCRDVASSGAGCTLLEAMRLQSQRTSTSECDATRIWVPQEITPVTNVKGFLDMEFPNAMLCLKVRRG